jgi:type III pantothenate kinase
MILAIDCGNSRLKWGLRDGGRWKNTGSIPLADVARLPAKWGRIAPDAKVVVANVAGPEVRLQLEAILAGRPRPSWVRAKRRECGVTNGYRRPAQLGADRWAALIGAWSILRGPCLVVAAGTATTADVLKGDGTFAGGAILPGLELMKQSLARSTAGLPFSKGRYSRPPRGTADAIETGCLLAQVGAIERMFAGMRPGAECVLTGGAAGRIARHLDIPVRIEKHLVLEGLVRIAREAVNRPERP